MMHTFANAEIKSISSIVSIVPHSITLNFLDEEVILLREGPIPIEENIQSIVEITLHLTKETS